jgi:hypothetical protein
MAGRRTVRGALAPVLAIALALAGCASPQVTPTVSESAAETAAEVPAPAAVTPPASAPAPTPAKSAKTGSKSGGKAGAKSGAKAAAAVATPKLRTDAPVRLVGLAPDQLDQLLGPANFRRADGPAELRQYRSDTCVLDVFLYPDAETGTVRVAHVEARNHTMQKIAAAGCITNIRNARRPQSAG